jgi:DNA-binding LytR/AlgR family response regulator
LPGDFETPRRNQRNRAVGIPFGDVALADEVTGDLINTIKLRRHASALGFITGLAAAHFAGGQRIACLKPRLDVHGIC